MKRCPECRRDYYDETLLYCLDDGNALLDGPASVDEPRTAILPNVSDENVTAVLASPTTSETSFESKKTIASNRNSLIAGVIGILFVTALGLGSYFYYGATAAKQIESIAVMPFINESGDQEVEYLSDGMTESLISSLSQVPNLSVKARSSVFRFKGKEASPQSLGKELNVQAILSGRLVQRGDELALHIEMVDTADETVLWKTDYTRPIKNLVAMQTEIARDISNKLRAKLTGTEQKQIEKKHTENAEAYQLYLKGRFHWNKRKPEEHTKAIQYFEQAIALDPNYALAYSGLADCYAVDSSPAKGDERDQKLRVAATKAMELDPTLGEPHAALANVYTSSYDWTSSENEYKKAIELNPDYPTAHQWYAEFLTRMGRHNEAIAEIDRARELDPLSLVINSDRVYILCMARRYDDAIAQAKKTLEMEVSWRQARAWLIFAHELKGEYEEALNEIEKYIQYSDRDADFKSTAMREVVETRAEVQRSGAEAYWRKSLEFEKADQAIGSEFSPSYLAAMYAILGEKDDALKWIATAIDEKDDGIDLLKVDPSFDNVRSDPRFAEQLKRLNLN